MSIMLIDCCSNYLDGKSSSSIESSITKPYANKLGILGSMMGNTMIQHLVQIGDSRQMEQVVNNPDEAQPTIINVAAKYVRKNEVINREIMNQQLSQIYNIALKQLSDNFYAQLFTIRLFTVKTITNSLQMMAAEKTGPILL